MKCILFILFFFITLTLCGNENKSGGTRSHLRSGVDGRGSPSSRPRTPSPSPRHPSLPQSPTRGEDGNLFEKKLKLLNIMDCYLSLTREEKLSFKRLFGEKIKYADIQGAQMEDVRKKLIRDMIDVAKEWTGMHPNLQRKLSALESKEGSCASTSRSQSYTRQIDSILETRPGLQRCIAMIAPDDQNRQSEPVSHRDLLPTKSLMRQIAREMRLECLNLLGCLCDIVMLMTLIAIVAVLTLNPVILGSYVWKSDSWKSDNWED